MIIWIALAGLALALILLVVGHDAGTVLGVLNEDFARLAALSAMGIVVGGGLLWQLRGNLFRALKMAVAWLAIACLLVVGYTFRHDAEFVFARVMSEIVPGRAIEAGDARVAVMRAGNGHFVVNTRVEGASIRMLFDTGASTVVLTPEDAAAAGIDLHDLVYSAPVWTANGRTTAAPVTLGEIEVGPIRVLAVRAVVSRPGALRESLLGMSFLDRISGWRVERDRLILDG